MPRPVIAPSLLSANLSDLKKEARSLEQSGAGWIHWDIMDGRFVPRKIFGPDVQEKIRPFSGLPFDTHLMVSRPERYIEAFAAAGSNYLTFHLEAVKDPLPVIQKIKRFGLKAGLAVKPKTPLSRLRPFLLHLDLVLIMTVEPGRGGQSFLKEAAVKAAALKARLRTLKNPPLISVDGGIRPETAPYVKTADVLVAGSFILQSGNYKKAILSLKKAYLKSQAL